MPIYEYICKNCGHQFETIQNFKDKPLKDCPECGKEKLEKKLSAPAFHLKGTGWYATDFKNPPKKNSEKDSTKTEESVTEKKDNKSDNK